MKQTAVKMINPEIPVEKIPDRANVNLLKQNAGEKNAISSYGNAITGNITYNSTEVLLFFLELIKQKDILIEKLIYNILIPQKSCKS